MEITEFFLTAGMSVPERSSCYEIFLFLARVALEKFGYDQGFII